MTAENKKKRLSRLSSVYIRSPVYFITACTHGRKQILANESVHESLVAFGQQGPEHGAWIGDYVLMPDHVHAFVTLNETQISLAKWGKSLKNSISKTLRRNGVIAPHWEKTFFDHVLRSSESYDSKWAYVRNNPVRAGLVIEPEGWPFMGQIYPLEFGRD